MNLAFSGGISRKSPISTIERPVNGNSLVEISSANHASILVHRSSIPSWIPRSSIPLIFHQSLLA